MATNPNPFLQSPIDAVVDEVEAKTRRLRASLPQLDAEVDADMPEADVAVAAPKAGKATAKAAKSDNYLPPPDIEPLFIAAAKKHNVPVNVLMAMGHQESGYRADAVGVETKWGKARGLMQNLDATAKGLGIDPMDPAQAIDAAAMQIRERLDRGMKMKDAVKEHFAGPDRAQWGEKTAAYGDEVMGKVKQIGKLLRAQAEQPAEKGKAAPNAFSQSMGRDDYLATFKANNPQAGAEAQAMAMQQFDAGQAQRAKATPVQDRFAQMADPVATFDAKLDKKLSKAKGVVPAMPSVAQPQQAAGPTDSPSLANDAQRGLRNLQAMAYGIAGMGADAMGMDAKAEKLLKEYVTITENNLRDNPAAIGSYKNVQDLGDAGRYAVEAVLENAAMIIPSLLTGGIGAQAAKVGAEKVVSGMIQKQVAQGIARSVAEKNALKFIAKRVTIGSGIGAYASSAPMEAGSIMGDIYAETGEMRAGTAALGGLAAGALDVIGPVMALRKIMGPVADDVAGHVIGRLGKEVGMQFLAESLTEGGQTFIEKAAVRSVDGKELLNTGLLDEMIDASLKGGIGGAVMGGASSAVEAVRAPAVAPTRVAPLPSDAAPLPATDSPLTSAMGETAAPAARVVVATPDGQSATGTVQDYAENESGQFRAEVLGDDGQVYTITDADGLQLVPVAPESGPLSSALEGVAAAEPVEVESSQLPATGAEPTLAPTAETTVADVLPGQAEIAPPQGEEAAAQPLPEAAEPAVPQAVTDMTDAQLRERMKYIAGVAKANGASKMTVAARREVEAEINRRAKAQPEGAANGSTDPVRNGDVGSGRAGGNVRGRGADGIGSGTDPAMLAEPRSGAAPTAQDGAGDAAVPGRAADQKQTLKIPKEGFGTSDLAKKFRKKAGLDESHEVVQTGRVRWEVRAKGDAAPNSKWREKEDAKAAKLEAALATANANASARKAAKDAEPRTRRDVAIIKERGSSSVDVKKTLAGLPPVADGHTRLFRAESPTVKFADVFDADGLADFQTDKPGERYTTDLKYADYYRQSYGRDASIHYIDVPNAIAEKGRLDEAEFAIKSEPQAITKEKPAAEKVPEVAPKESRSLAQENARAAMIAELKGKPAKTLRDIASNHKRSYMRVAAADILQERADATASKRSEAMKKRMKRDARIDSDVDHMLQAIAKMGGINRASAAGRFRFAPEEMNIKAKVGNLARHVFVKNGGMSVEDAGAAMADLGYVGFDDNGKHDQSDWEDLLSRAAGGEEVYTATGMVSRAEAARFAEMEALQVESEAEMQEIEGYADDLVDWADDADIAIPDAPELYLDENNNPLITEDDINGYFGDQQEESAGGQDPGDSQGQARAGTETGADAPQKLAVEQPVKGYQNDFFFDQGDLFANVESRPGTVEAQKQGGRDAVMDLARRLGIDRVSRLDRSGGGKVSVLGKRLLANFIAGKPNQLVGQTIATPGDLAALAQVYRDPRFETFRILYMRGTEVVGEAGYTSRLPSQVTMPPDLAKRMKSDMNRFGASGYYVMHNHPSGDPSPSPADQRLTNFIDQEVPGFKSHVVIDHNRYAVIQNWGHEVIDAPELNGKDFTAMPEVEHALLGVKINSPESVARLAKTLEVPSGYATLILTTAPGEVQLIVDVPVAALQTQTRGERAKVKGLVRRMARETGSGGHRFLILPKGAEVRDGTFVRMLADGVLTDVVSSDGSSARALGSYAGENFLNKNDKSMVVGEESESFLQAQTSDGLKAKAKRAADQQVADRDTANTQRDAFALTPPPGSVTGEAKAMANSRQEALFSTGAKPGTLTTASLRKSITTGTLGTVVDSMVESGLIVLHADTSTLPVKNVPKAVQALTAPDGKVHLIAANLNQKNARAVMLHEAFHQGAQSLIGTPEWSVLMRRMKSLMAQGKEASKGGKANVFYTKAHARVASAKAQGAVEPHFEAEEFAAYAIEEYESAPSTVQKWVDDLIGMVKAWMVARFGKQFGEITPAQLSAIAKLAIMDVAVAKRGEMFGPAGELLSIGERRTRTIEVDGVRRPITNSKGQLVAQDFAGQMKFWEWFGSSAAVDAEGRPVVIMHGTTADVSAFDPAFSGSDGVGYSAPAFFGTDDAFLASDYSVNKFNRNIADAMREMQRYKNENPGEYGEEYESRHKAVKAAFKTVVNGRELGDGANVIPMYMSMKNPLIIDAQGKRFMAVMPDAVARAVAEGFDGAIVSNVIDHASPSSEYPATVYFVLKPTQIKSATGNAGSFDPANPDIRYSVAAADAPAGEDADTDTGLMPPEQGLLRRVQASIQDQMNRVKQVQEKIEKVTGKALPETMDYYLAETNRPGRIAARLEDGENDLFAPLMTRLAKAGHTPDQLQELLHAMHAAERNETVARINPDTAEGSGMSDEKANKILKKYEDEGFASLHRLADETRAIARHTLDLKLAYGLLTPERHEQLTDHYQFYVPLKGDGEYGVKVKQAMGHEARDEFIVENILRDFKQAVVAGEKNMARQVLLRMILKNPDSLLWSVGIPPKGRYIAGKVYEVFKGKVKVASFDSPSAVAAFLEGKKGEAVNYTVKDSAGMQVAEFTKQLQDNEVMVYLEGQAVRVQIYDEALAKQLRPLNRGQMNWFWQQSQKLNRYYSKIYTGYNPAFILRNAARDSMTGSVNMMGNYGITTAAKAWARYPMALAALGYWASTGKIPKGATGDMLRAYRDHGGKVGASHMGDLEAQGVALKRIYEDAKGALSYAAEGKVPKAAWIAARKAIHKLARVVEIANQATENALRLALFMELRAQGESPAKAAQAAKTVTVDFDRKGSSTAALGAAYLFFNPAVQGSANGIKTLAKGKHKAQAWGAMGALAMLGYWLATKGMDEDKDRWLGEKWDIRTKNLIINGKDHQVRVPVSQEFAPFFAFGHALAEVSRGEKKSTVSIRLLSSFMDAYIPLRGAYEPDSDNHGADLLLALTPSVGQMPAQLAMNRNSFGSQIVPESGFTQDRPDNLKMNRATKNSAYDKAAQKIAAGGEALLGAGRYENDISKVSPETLKLLWANFTGGLGTFVADSVGVAAMGADPSIDVTRGEVPIVKDFVRTQTVKPLRSRYYDLTREARTAIDEFKQARKAGDGEAMDKVLADEGKAAALGLDKMIKADSKAAKALREEAVDVNAATDLTPGQKRARLKELEQEEEALYREAIKAFQE